MTTAATKVLLFVGVTLCVLAVIFALGAIFVPDFRDDGTLIAGTILGALVTMGTTIAATFAAQAYNKKNGNNNG